MTTHLPEQSFHRERTHFQNTATLRNAVIMSHAQDVQVRVMAAFDLQAVNLGGWTSDPYAKLQIARTKELHETTTCLNTVNPTWYETMVFHSVRPSDVIQVTLFDRNQMTPDRPIGAAQISLASGLQHCEAVFTGGNVDRGLFGKTPEPSAPPIEEIYDPPPPPPPPQGSAPPSAPSNTTHAPYSTQSYPHAGNGYPAYYPPPSQYQAYPPPSPGQPQQHHQSMSNDHSSSSLPPNPNTVDAAMQRRMTMKYRVGSRGSITFIIAPQFVPDLEQGAPRKPFKRFQINKLHEQVAGKQSVGASLGKFIKSGVEKAKPLQVAFHALEPIHGAFQEHSTWKITLADVDEVFRGKRHHWNTSYPAAQKIFQGPGSVVTKRMVQLQHAYLYGGGAHIKLVQNFRKELQEVTGNLIDGRDFLHLLHHGVRRGKSRLFTYVIEPNRLYLAETGARFFRDMYSKHAMHCSASTEVVYAGELHVRRIATPSGEPGYLLVVDNNSGTYAPGKEDLPLVEEVFRRNFPGINVVALDFQSTLLKRYVSELPENSDNSRRTSSSYS